LYASKSRSAVLIHAELKIQYEYSQRDILRNDWLGGALGEPGNLHADGRHNLCSKRMESRRWLDFRREFDVTPETNKG